MGRSLPVWLFLLCLLLGSLITLIFGWSVKSTVDGAEGSVRFGRLGEVSVVVASFPDLVRGSLGDIGADPDVYLRVPRTSADLADFHPARMKPDIHVQGLMVRADGAALARASGWRILVGPFVIDGELNHAALALSPELEIVNAWVLREEGIQGQKPQSTGRKHIHGFALLKDGSMIFIFNNGVSIQRLDRCGRKIWSTGGNFHHSINIDEDEKFVWALSYNNVMMDEVVQLAAATGEVVRQFSMEDIIAANPTIDILEIRQQNDSWGNGNPRNTSERWHRDPIHLNDVEPLPAGIADRFQDYEAGDLLLSARVLNLVFVLDPETLKVKWWQGGAWRRQHDPDWQPTGEITVYDNRTDRDYSRIVSITPALKSTRVVFDGRTNDWYSRIRGNHQITKAGNILITSPQQGRVFEIDRLGRLVFDMFNTKLGSTEFNYFIADATWFPSEAFDLTKDLPCAN